MDVRNPAYILSAAILLAACSPVSSQQEETELIGSLTTGTQGTPLPTPTSAEQDLPSGASQFKTDFSIHSVAFSEILSGGPGKDGIPAIDAPKFVTTTDADEWLQALEPVIMVQIGDQARAYPIQILIWHEIVNDWIGDLPLMVTFCPLCNTAIAFERRVGDQVLTFGTTGNLRYSNLIMYDRQTESWWQQATGDAIVGELTGTDLNNIPATIVAWQDFRDSFSHGLVLSRETGYLRDYGRNPYTGYDDINSSPFLYVGPTTPDALPPMARVLTLDLGGEAVAFPYETLAQEGVVNETVGGRPVSVFWQPGVASPLDVTSVGQGKDVGSAVAFSREFGDANLTFSFINGTIKDKETGSIWDIFGRAIEGRLAGSQLEPVVSINHFWFSWAAFKPETRIYLP